MSYSMRFSGMEKDEGLADIRGYLDSYFPRE